eukprot:CAMPEP_0170073834 /NCGR_PEP_ID=MMETSP0019_2-20121128/11208_1 /TAXON_ID=98059 /ORGANISM="Dinobryon sp., Strain UTEXLB2267" /LENGTH=36 /DNA_ID= /DNA_START= /DNA_END= /DNA_ORIENTATION=
MVAGSVGLLDARSSRWESQSSVMGMVFKGRRTRGFT